MLRFDVFHVFLDSLVSFHHYFIIWCHRDGYWHRNQRGGVIILFAFSCLLEFLYKKPTSFTGFAKRWLSIGCNGINWKSHTFTHIFVTHVYERGSFTLQKSLFRKTMVYFPLKTTFWGYYKTTLTTKTTFLNTQYYFVIVNVNVIVMVIVIVRIV